LSALIVEDLRRALDRSVSQLEDGARDKGLANSLDMLAAALDADSGDNITRKRQTALAETLSRIATRLR
jgi:hypothetical protein